MRRPAALAVPLLLLAAVLAGCNDDGGSSVSAADDGGATATTGGDTTTDDGEATDDPRTDEELAADEAAAAEDLLTVEDLGTDWQAQPREEDEESQDEFNAELADCIGVDPALLDRDNPSAQSDDFVNTLQQTVNNEITYTPSEEDAAESLAIIERAETPDCFAVAVDTLIQANLAELQSEAGQEIEVGTPTVEPAEMSELGDGSAGLVITVPLSTPQGDAELYLANYAVQVGRVGVELQTQSVGVPFDPAEAERLLGIVIERIEGTA